MLRTGGSDVAYHESTYAYGRFSAKPLVGFTNSDGRYSEGVYGQWYPASDSQVYPYTFPSSEYPKEAKTLSELRASFGSDGGLPPDAWRSVLDPLECVSLDSLARKTERAIARGRLDAARRMFSRLQQAAPDAPLVRELERTVNESKQ